MRYAIVEVKGGIGYSNTDINANILEPTSSTTVDRNLTGQLTDVTATLNREALRIVHEGVVLVGSSSTPSDAMPATKQVKFSSPYKRQWRYSDSDTADPLQNRLVLLVFARQAGNDVQTPTIEVSGTLTLEYHSV